MCERRERGQRGCDLAKVLDEFSIKIGEAQEAAELRAICGLFPVGNCHHLLGISLHRSPFNDVSQELHRWRMKDAFLRLDEESVLQKPLENCSNMQDVFIKRP